MEKGIHKQRILILLAICLGSLSAGLFLRFRQLPQAQMTDQQAISLGYSSAADQQQTAIDFRKYWPDVVGKGRLTDWEYDLAVKTLKSGSRASKARIIAVLGYVRGDTERKRAIALMPSEPIEPAALSLWRSAFHRWMDGKKDEGVLQLLAASGNANAAKIADELRSAASA